MLRFLYQVIQQPTDKLNRTQDSSTTKHINMRENYDCSAVSQTVS